ncbi:MAG: hypothetical protein AzoDbin1_01066 [Azoarcus sp.]|nr:hypothetical protein [Azoarcus sp.]
MGRRLMQPSGWIGRAVHVIADSPVMKMRLFMLSSCTTCGAFRAKRPRVSRWRRFSPLAASTAGRFTSTVRPCATTRQAQTISAAKPNSSNGNTALAKRGVSSAYPAVNSRHSTPTINRNVRQTCRTFSIPNRVLHQIGSSGRRNAAPSPRAVAPRGGTMNAPDVHQKKSKSARVQSAGACRISKHGSVASGTASKGVQHENPRREILLRETPPRLSSA